MLYNPLIVRSVFNKLKQEKLMENIKAKKKFSA